ncbi:MAG: DUF3299 domain-containing protein [Planctomycetota bacterium]
MSRGPMWNLTKSLVALAALALPVADEPETVDFASLSDFKYVEGMELPAHVTKLHEKKVRISGFMAREVQGEGPVEYFLLINDACGCEGVPFLNEVLFCAMPEGEKTEILPGSVALVGTLFVGEIVEEDCVVALYCLDVDKIETGSGR